MYAIEFETEITGKYIELADYERVVNKHAKVILLFEDQEPDNRLPVEKIFFNQLRARQDKMNPSIDVDQLMQDMNNGLS